MGRRHLCQITDDLVADLEGMTFGPPVTHVYNALSYARANWDLYCDRYGRAPKQIVMLGMNPGPWGMAQTGVPFGEIAAVRDWMGLDGAIGKPPVEHPKRPVLGLACERSEVSGRRLWGWAQDTFGRPDDFFSRFFVYNYCPLSFMEHSGRNRIPEKLPKAEREPLFAACDRALMRSFEVLQPELVIGVGAFARKRAEQLLKGTGTRVGQILHPSPASPLANRGWAPQAAAQLSALGVELPEKPGM